MIDLTGITIPTPTPYSATDPQQQRENLCYVLLQVLQKFQAAETDVDVVTALKDLQFENITFTFGNLKVVFDGKTASLSIV